jgi:VanZ family protein
MIKKNKFSVFVALIILYLSLASSDTFNEVPLFDIPYLDKIVHFGMYFGFMSVIIFENRKTLNNNVQLFLISLIPLLYGILMEIFQATLTTTRSGSIYDVIFNFAGILISLILWLLIKPFMKDQIRL